VLQALRSRDYKAILSKLADSQFDLAFNKKDIQRGISDIQNKKLNNFLQRMKKLKVLKQGEERGEYIFNSRLVRLYLRLAYSKPLKIEPQ